MVTNKKRESSLASADNKESKGSSVSWIRLLGLFILVAGFILAPACSAANNGDSTESSATPQATPQTEIVRPLTIEVPVLEEEVEVTEEVTQPQPTVTTTPTETPTPTPTPQVEEEVNSEEDSVGETETPTEDIPESDPTTDPTPEIEEEVIEEEDTTEESKVTEDETEESDPPEPEPVVEDETEEDTIIEEPVHIVSVPGNWSQLSLSQQLMLNPYQCTHNSQGVILFSAVDATCLTGSPSALAGPIESVIGDDIPVDDTSEAPEDEEVVEKPPTTVPPPEEEESAHTVTVPGNWWDMYLHQHLMLNPYQCLPNSEGVIWFSYTDATCAAGSTSALTGEIVVVIGPDIPVVPEYDSEGRRCLGYWGLRPDGSCYYLIEVNGYCSEYPSNYLLRHDADECFWYEPNDGDS